MEKAKLLKYLQEEESKAFSGWDFSYLDGRWSDEPLPWNYIDIVRKYLIPTLKLLDIGTGGGEILSLFNHPYQNTCVTEGYRPNYELCMEKLAPLGIKVYNYVGDEIFQDIKDNEFDIVINRQESYNECELKRILKPNGIFITQQVGSFNNNDLSRFFDDDFVISYPELTLDKSIIRLEENDFDILYKNEHFPILKFYDLGAIAYFAKIIKWEFKDFSVLNKIDKFLKLQDELKQKGYISSKQHRFIIVAKRKEK